MPRVLAFIAALFVLIFVAGCSESPNQPVPGGAVAATDCGKWLTSELAKGKLTAAFWKEAGAADVERCLSAGADIKARDQGGRTPLHWAARDGTAATVNALLDRGADITARANRFGGTPLHHAAGRGTAETVNALLDRGADPNVRNPNRTTPLYWAAASGTAATVNALLDRGADITARNRLGQTPLHHAAGWGSAETVNALLDRGADPTARTADGKTPFDLSRENRALRGTDAYLRLKDGRSK